VKEGVIKSASHYLRKARNSFVILRVYPRVSGGKSEGPCGSVATAFQFWQFWQCCLPSRRACGAEGAILAISRQTQLVQSGSKPVAGLSLAMLHQGVLTTRLNPCTGVSGEMLYTTATDDLYQP